MAIPLERLENDEQISGAQFDIIELLLISIRNLLLLDQEAEKVSGSYFDNFSYLQVAKLSPINIELYTLKQIYIDFLIIYN